MWQSQWLPQQDTVITCQRSKPAAFRAITRCPGDKPPRNGSGYQSLTNLHDKTTFIAGYSNYLASYSHQSVSQNKSSKMLVTNTFAGGTNKQDNFVATDEQLVDHSKESDISPQHTIPLSINKQFTTISDTPINETSYVTCVAVEESAAGSESSCVVLLNRKAKLLSAKVYASLPQHSKYIVKERFQNLFGVVKAKFVVKCNSESCVPEVAGGDHDYDVEHDGDIKGNHYEENTKRPGYVIYTCDGRFCGHIKYPLPNENAATCRIGKGGNGSVFIVYHDRKEYAVKQTVYRPNEVNVHSALKHKNILPLLAVLMGRKHEIHRGKFHCYHFMPRMDYDLRQILSAKGVGCLKYLYQSCLNNPAKFERAYGNIKYTLKETLQALAYIHSKGYVHRDVKASNIMIRMNCKCHPLYCGCISKFQVKVGDFDSAGIVPGLNIKEPTDQMIKFASILPLGTPGYRAPEVSMHITLSGPYETLYTTAVDIWSFGCLCLNICIGKTAASRQREEASLLLSLTHQCSKELWSKTTKIHELQKTQPFMNDTKLVRLIQSCLQVNYKHRPSSVYAQGYL